MHTRSALLRSLLLTIVASSAVAQTGEEKIRDNLFLLEEAYNQEPGVIQHIQSFTFSPGARTWSYSFTEEWPAPTDRHQLSITIPTLRPDAGAASGLGDIALNYRLQALGMGGEGRVAIAPRLSLLAPTGDYRRGNGRGAPGAQVNLPVSIDLSEKLVTHLNAGLTYTPRARSPHGARAPALDTSAGVAFVWLPLHWMNPLLEVVRATTEEIGDDGRGSRAATVTLNPGVRFAVDRPSGLQIVPGISAPLLVSDGDREWLALLYLSFEHPLWHPSSREHR